MVSALLATYAMDEVPHPHPPAFAHLADYTVS